MREILDGSACGKILQLPGLLLVRGLGQYSSTFWFGFFFLISNAGYLSHEENKLEIVAVDWNRKEVILIHIGLSMFGSRNLDVFNSDRRSSIR